jgi:hypothetical protein
MRIAIIIAVSGEFRIFVIFYSLASQRFALAAGGRGGKRLEMQKKLEARKMLENAADSHPSAARCVGRLYARLAA